MLKFHAIKYLLIFFVPLFAYGNNPSNYKGCGIYDIHGKLSRENSHYSIVIHSNTYSEEKINLLVSESKISKSLFFSNVLVNGMWIKNKKQNIIKVNTIMPALHDPLKRHKSPINKIQDTCLPN